MMIPTLAALSLIVAPAEAGKLANGWRGQSWGPVDVKVLKRNAPGSCGYTVTPRSFPNAETFFCQQDFGPTTLSVLYIYQSGVFWGVKIDGTSYAECGTLLDIMTAAYGKSMPQDPSKSGPNDPREWKDGDGIAAWTPEYGGTCMAFALNERYRILAEKPSKDAAKKAAESL